MAGGRYVRGEHRERRAHAGELGVGADLGPGVLVGGVLAFEVGHQQHRVAVERQPAGDRPLVREVVKAGEVGDVERVVEQERREPVRGHAGAYPVEGARVEGGRQLLGEGHVSLLWLRASL
ncbi:hypothetical protein GCM10020001_085690 [Nonomuraea salmonea]